ncbi:hypothetical protein E3N88_34297 [Mikania micrantha]|uniref:diacylglycerol O-acyltransferase n=1 Tax=Mikania micrantha TaxID=192012 RepID=A0A5N6LXQ7_9ASTR|nr:hypothetical protein E3N88_34297 [Mikania micrantha]
MIKHPRFSSLLVTDDEGREYWQKTELDIDRHIVFRPDPVDVGFTDEEAVNDYIADLTVSHPLCTDKPLWEVHVLSAHKCVVLRVHHALGDGISLMSLILTLFRKRDDPMETPTIEPLTSSIGKRRKLGIMENALKLLKTIWFTLIYVCSYGAWTVGQRRKDGGQRRRRGGDVAEKTCHR